MVWQLTIWQLSILTNIYFRNKVPKVVLAEDEVYFTEERVAALQRKAKLLEVLFYPFFNPKSTRDILGQHFFMELTVLLLDSN